MPLSYKLLSILALFLFFIMKVVTVKTMMWFFFLFIGSVHGNLV
jgi:hypothetical protein